MDQNLKHELDKLAERRVEEEKASRQLSNDSVTFLHINCSDCLYGAKCPYSLTGNPGCTMRKELFESYYSEIKFKTDNPFAVNQIRLLAKYVAELLLTRNFGGKLTDQELQLLKIVSSEFARLSVNTKGELIDSKSKIAVPWELTPEVEKMKKELEEAKKTKEENEKLKMQLEVKKKKEKDASDIL